MKKRVLAGILTGMMTISVLAGCGGSGEGSSAAASSAASTAQAASSAADASSAAADAAGDDLHMTLIMSIRDEWLSSMESACVNLADEMGIELTTQDANNDQSKQIQYIETAKNAGEDAVLLNIIDEGSLHTYHLRRQQPSGRLWPDSLRVRGDQSGFA